MKPTYAESPVRGDPGTQVRPYAGKHALCAQSYINVLTAGEDSDAAATAHFVKKLASDGEMVS